MPDHGQPQASWVGQLADFMTRRLLAVNLLAAPTTHRRDCWTEPILKACGWRFWLFRGFEEARFNVFYFHESRARGTDRASFCGISVAW